MNPKVDNFINNARKWQEEINTLRLLMLECGLNEEFKWGTPCYTYNGNNVVLIHSFKNYCAVLFFKGSLLSDESAILIQQTQNVQASRQVRFTNNDEIIKIEAILKSYIFEAVEIERAGLKVEVEKTIEVHLPEELKKKMSEMPILRTAFESLTPGRQRAYILYFSQAKQSKTIESRIEKYLERILNGKGINDCICGLSHKLPGCDGTHKALKNK